MWLKHPKTKDPSPSLSIFTYGAVALFLKLLISGLEVGQMKFGEFTGSEFAMAFGALSAYYWAKRNAVIGKKE